MPLTRASEVQCLDCSGALETLPWDQLGVGLPDEIGARCRDCRKLFRVDLAAIAITRLT